MTGFLIAAAALVLVALAVLLPLLFRRASSADAWRVGIIAAIYRDQLGELEGDLAAGSLSRADFEQGKCELKRRLLEDAQAEALGAPTRRAAKWSAWLIALALPLTAGLAYALLGNPAPGERQEFAAATGHWERVLRQFPADSEAARSLAYSIERARDAQAHRSQSVNSTK